MKKSKYILCSVVAASFLFSGCSGGGSASSSEQSPSLTTGMFIDDPVIGLNYQCTNDAGVETSTGITNDAGEYTCATGDNVTFSIGQATIGTIAVQSKAVTPYSFFEADDIDSAVNLARLLQTVDDGSVKGMLKLDPILKNKIPATTDFTDADFAQTAASTLGRELIDEETAKDNMDEAIVNYGGSVGTDDNYIPIANAGDDIFVLAGGLVNLDASESSDADGDSLTYEWTLTLKPAGSTAELSNSTSATPSFTADVDGRYVASVVVSDATTSSSADTVRINTNITEYEKLQHSLTTGASDDSITITKKINAGSVIDTGAGNDTLSIAGTLKDAQVLTGTGTDSVTVEKVKNSIIKTGSENDTLSIEKLDGGDASIDTGSGNDTVTLDVVSGGYDEGSFTLNDGDDTLTIHDNLSGTETIFYGGDGNDTLNLTEVSNEAWDEGIKNLFSGFENVALQESTGGSSLGATGFDREVLDDEELLGSDEDDTISISKEVVNGSLVNTGAGNDTFYTKKLEDSAIITGTGDDNVTVKKLDGGSATIDTGSGADRVILHSVSGGYDDGSVNLGSGDDILTSYDSLGGTESTFDGGDGYDIINLSKVKLDKWNDGVKDLFSNFEYVTLKDASFALDPAKSRDALDPVNQISLFPGHTTGSWSNLSSFAALKENGDVLTWGKSTTGGDSSSVVLEDVQAIYSTLEAFAAIKVDKSVVTWGYADRGGDSSSVQLQDVKAVYSTQRAFAALKENGDVVSWGESGFGGDSSLVELEDVKTVYSSKYAFAALKDDGTVVTWGDSDFGGDSSSVELEDIKAIYSTDKAFAALKDDGTVLTWGSVSNGGDSSSVELEDVVTVYSTQRAFAALKEDGTVVTWGDDSNGGNSSSVDLTDVKNIHSAQGAFAAIKGDGSVVTWGENSSGGDISAVALSDVKTIYSTLKAFAALKEDGTVVTWGYSSHGGDSSSVELEDIKEIYTVEEAFAALKDDGTVLTWGDPDNGGDSSSVNLSDVKTIYSTKRAFAALKENGDVVTWGDSNFGGDSSSVELTQVKTLGNSYIIH